MILRWRGEPPVDEGKRPRLQFILLAAARKYDAVVTLMHRDSAALEAAALDRRDLVEHAGHLFEHLVEDPPQLR